MFSFPKNDIDFFSTMIHSFFLLDCAHKWIKPFEIRNIAEQGKSGLILYGFRVSDTMTKMYHNTK